VKFKERRGTMQDTVKSDIQNRDLLYSQILDALETMPNRLREVFVLQHYDGMSEQAIARKTGIQPVELASLVGEANSTFQRALRNG
jgi:DNA-directed RNA polymerase specialized sigma24 family protein